MVLTNAQRQALYRQRIKAQAAQAADLTESMAELLRRYRQMIADLDLQIEALESGAVRFLRGSSDATADALARARGQRSNLQELVDKHDPTGVTGL